MVSSPWAVLIASTVALLISSTTYVFPKYVGEFAEVTGIGQSQSVIVIASLDAGYWFAAMPGIVMAWIGPATALSLAATLSVAGYGTMWAMAVKLFPRNILLEAFAVFLVGQSSSLAYISLIAINIRNWNPAVRGKIVGILCTAAGMTAPILSVWHHAAFRDNGTFFGVLAAVVFLALLLVRRAVTVQHRRRPTARWRSLGSAYGVLILALTYCAAIEISRSVGWLADYRLPHALPLLLLPFLLILIPIANDDTPVYMTPIDRGDRLRVIRVETTTAPGIEPTDAPNAVRAVFYTNAGRAEDFRLHTQPHKARKTKKIQKVNPNPPKFDDSLPSPTRSREEGFESRSASAAGDSPPHKSRHIPLAHTESGLSLQYSPIPVRRAHSQFVLSRMGASLDDYDEHTPSTNSDHFTQNDTSTNVPTSTGAASAPTGTWGNAVSPMLGVGAPIEMQHALSEGTDSTADENKPVHAVHKLVIYSYEPNIKVSMEAMLLRKEIVAALRTQEYWMLAAVLAATLGSTVAVVHRVRAICVALMHDGALPVVSRGMRMDVDCMAALAAVVFSVSNCSGRLAAGLLADRDVFRFRRSEWLVICASVTAIGHVYLTIMVGASDKPSVWLTLLPSLLLMGFGFGGAMCLTPLLVAEHWSFGLFNPMLGFLMCPVAVGSIVFSLAFWALPSEQYVQYHHDAYCVGASCLRLFTLITACASVIAVGMALYRLESLQPQEYPASDTDASSEEEMHVLVNRSSDTSSSSGSYGSF